MREMLFGLEERHVAGNPKQQELGGVTALLWDLLNKNTASLKPTKILKNRC